MSTKHGQPKEAVKQQPGSVTKNNHRAVIVGAVVLFIALCVTITANLDQYTSNIASPTPVAHKIADRAGPSTPSMRSTHVPVIAIDDDQDITFVQRYIAKQLITSETKELYEHVTDWPWPAVFRGTAVTRWTALRTWSASQLASVLG